MPTLTKYCFFTVAIEWLLSGYWVATEWLLSGYGIVAKWTWILQAAADCDVRAYAQVCWWLFMHEHDSGQQFIWKTSHVNVNLSIEGFLRPVLYTSTFNLPILCIHHLPSKHLRRTLRFNIVLARTAFGNALHRRRNAERFSFSLAGYFLSAARIHSLSTNKVGHIDLRAVFRHLQYIHAYSTTQSHTDKRILIITFVSKSHWVISYIDKS